MDGFVPNTVEALNTQTGEIENLPNDAAFSAFQSGKYKFDPTSKLKVFDKFGTPKTIVADHLDSAIKAGYQAATTEQQKEYYLQKKYGDNTGEALAEGAARGLTLGLSDPLLKAAGVSEERLGEVKKRSPIAANVGEYGTIAASVAVPALAAGKLGTIAKTAGVIPNVVSKIGTTVEKAVAKKILGETFATAGTKAASKTLAKSIVENMVSKGVGGAVEGSIYSMGNLISEDAIGDKDLNAENIVSALGVGALVGGGLGMGVGAIGGAIKAFKPSVAEEAAQKATLEAESSASTSAAANAESSVTTKITISPEDRQLGKLVKQDPKDIAYYKDRSAHIDTQPRLGTDLDPSKGQESLEDVFRRNYDDLGPRIKELSEKSNDLLGNSPIVKNAGEIQKYIDESISELSSRKIKGNETKKALARLQELKDQVMPVRDKSGKITSLPSQQYSSQDIKGLIQELDKDLEGFYARKLGGKATTESERAIQGLRSRISDGLKLDLKNAGFPEYEKYMAEMRDLIGVQQKFEKNFSVNNAYSQRLLKTLERNEAGFQSGQALTKRGQKEAQSWMKTIDDLGRVSGVDYRQIYKDRAVAARLFPQAAEGAERGSVFGNLARMGWDAAKYGMNPGGLAKDILIEQKLNLGQNSEVIQNLKMKAFHELLNNQGTMKAGALSKLAKIVSMVNTQKSQVIDAIGRAASPTTKKSLSGLLSPSILHEVSYTSKADRPKNRHDAFEKVSTELSELMADPATLAQKIGKNVAGLSEVAPNTADAAAQTTVKAIQYLHETMPKDPSAGLSWTKNKWVPSDFELAKWERRIQAVEKPMSVLDDIADGQGTSEGVETLKKVYPKLYNQIVLEITKQVVEQKKEIPYQKKLQLGMLLAAPLDYSMQPAFIQKMQGMFKQEPQPQQGGSLSGDLFKSTLSRSQSLEAK